jgi:DNA polymerase-3 subunit gamma/tau
VTALYRRYRPETFQEVIGQSHVTDPLRHALVANRANHAYLFSGPRGCGKTTSARILARCLNCAEGPTDTPCGVCSSCVELSRDGGGSLDVVEIDAASHNGVDDARELRERAVFAPARDRFKIYILDEAHMVTQQGFNALLKIVEEPPPHVKFIFATTEPEKVLTTIRSRTHHYPFRLVPPGELLSYLESLVDSEGISVDEGVLALVVRSGGGSVRDSLSLLDQLIAGSTENTISLASAQALLGYTPRAVLDEVLSGIASTDAGAVFNAIDRMIHTGQDPRRFVEDLLSHLRDVIVVQATSGDASALFPGVSASDLDTCRRQSKWFSPQALSQMAERVNHALTEMSGVTSPKLQLELLMASLLSAHENGGESSPSSVARPSTAETSAQVAPAAKNLPDAPSEASAPEQELTEETAPSTPEPIEPIKPWTLESLDLVWPKIIESLALNKRSLWVALSETKPLAVEEDVISIGFVRRSDAEILK